MARRKESASAGAPEWMVTFGDMMSLLLCFFVIIVSMSEIKKDERFQLVMESIKQAFGNSGEFRAVPTRLITPSSLLIKLQEVIIPLRPEDGDADDAGIQGKVFRVTDVREGIHVQIGGRISFDRFSATLREQAEYLISQVAEKTRGHNTIIKVTGHATNEPLPPDSTFADPWALSYARARAVATVLERQGIRPERLRLVAAGAEAPLKPNAYTEEERTLNRRVEIVVTEATIDDYLSVSEPVEEQPDGG